jgi:hypothetical protein
MRTVHRQPRKTPHGSVQQPLQGSQGSLLQTPDRPPERISHPRAAVPRAAYQGTVAARVAGRSATEKPFPICHRQVQDAVRRHGLSPHNTPDKDRRDQHTLGEYRERRTTTAHRRSTGLLNDIGDF